MTSPKPIGYAQVAGSAVGALVVGAAFGAGMLWSDQGFVLSDLKSVLGMTMLTVIVAFVLWFLGIVVLGSPVWGWLHDRGHESPTSAAVTGAVLPFLTVLVFTLLGDLIPFGLTSSSVGGVDLVVNGRHTVAGWLSVAQGGLLLGAVGALVGLVIWRVAYRPIQIARHLAAWVVTIAIFPVGLAVLPDEPKDLSCHNVLRDGRRSESAVVSMALDIEDAQRPRLRRALARFGHAEGMDVRDGSSVTPDLDKLDVSLCMEAGPTIAAYDLDFADMADVRGLPRTSVQVFQPRGGSWRAEARRLSDVLEREFPGKLSYTNGRGGPIRMPEYAVEPAR